MSFWEHFTLGFHPQACGHPKCPKCQIQTSPILWPALLHATECGDKVNSDKQSALRKSDQDLR